MKETTAFVLLRLNSVGDAIKTEEIQHYFSVLIYS